MSKAVLFDMDGVLVDSEKVMLKAAAEGMRKFDINAVPEDFVPYIGLEAEKYFGNVMEKYGKHYSEEVKIHIYNIYGTIISSQDVCQYAIEILSALNRQSIPFAICSGAVRQKVQHNLEALGLLRNGFSAIITGDDVNNNKPHPEIYLKGAEMLEVDPADCIVVEDSLSGIQAGRASGAITVGVGTSFSKADFEKEGKMDYFIETLADLPKVLEINGIFLK